MMKVKLPRLLILFFLFLILGAVILLSSFIGPAGFFPSQKIILWQIRIPRVILGALVGLSLATSGAILQGILRNPLADPYILGVSSGAAVGAVLGFLLNLELSFFGLTSIPLLAFLGALLAVLIVYRVSYVGGRASPETLILAGVAVGSFGAAVLSFLVMTSDRLQSVYFWLLGGLSAGGWTYVWMIFPYAALGFLAACLFSKDLNIMLLGDEPALGLGVEVERVRLILLFTASLMAAAAVSVSGLIGFVGLIVPHVVRLIAGPDHRFLIPLSALGGAVLLVSADILARTIWMPTEIPAGIITALMGAPFFIYLLRRRKESK